MRIPSFAVWLVTTTLAAAGCRFEVDYSASHFTCDDGVCPGDMQCVAGYCEPAGGGGADAAPGADASADASPTGDVDAAPMPAARCGKASLFADDFEDGKRDPEWGWSYNDGNTALDELNGHMRVTLPLAGGAGQEAAYLTSHAYDLRDDRVFVEVPGMVSTSSHAYVFLTAFAADAFGSAIQIVQEHGTLYFEHRIAGTTTPIATVPYDPVAHRWWQLRETAGMTYWETSPDGLAWTVQAMEPTTVQVTLVRTAFGAGTYQAEAAPGNARFDNYDGGGAGEGVWCKASSFADDFADGKRDARWSSGWDGSGCTVAESGDRVTIAPSTTSMVDCGYLSAARYDLTDDSVLVEVPAMVDTAAAVDVELIVQRDWSNEIRIMQEKGSLYLVHTVNDAWTEVGKVPWDPVADRWWRLRVSGGHLYYETSPDGAAWIARADEPAPFALDAVEVLLWADTWQALTSAPGVAAFDDYNRAP